MSQAARAILDAALNLQDGMFRPLPGAYLELTSRGLARERLRWAVRHDREAVQCGRWVGPFFRWGSSKLRCRWVRR